MEKVRLGDVCTVRGGYAFKSELFKNEGIPIIRIGNITKDGLVVDEDICYNEAFWDENLNYRVQKNDILIAMSGATVGKSCINHTERKLLLNQRVASVICDGSINLKYIFYSIDSENFLKYIMANSIGCAQPNVSLKQISDFEIPNICEEEQKRIADELDKVSNLINKRKQQLSKLDELVKARFVELFGEVGTDTKGWGLKRLGDCCTINPKKGEDKRLHQDLIVSFIPMPAVSEKGEIDASETKSYNEVKTGFTYFAEQDVLFAKITPCMENGKGAVAKGLCNGIGFGSTEFHVLRPVEGVSNPYWIYTVTVFEQFRVDAANNMTGSAGQRRGPASFLEAYKVALPPIGLQNQFANFVEQTDKSKLEIRKSLEKLELLKKALMQKYFG